ncbi:MAG: EamA family transporter [Moorea sp. SIO2B7]|nr:EamA family transporter [Moorena sp. SIO2B7]
MEIEKKFLQSNLFSDIHSFLLLLILALICGAYQLFWVWSLTQTSVANSEVMHCLAPLFITLIGWSLFGQQFDRKFLIGMTIAITCAISLNIDSRLFLLVAFVD